MYKRKVAKDHEAAEKKKGEERSGAIVAFVAFCARKNEKKKKEARSEYMQLIAFCARKKRKKKKAARSEYMQLIAFCAKKKEKKKRANLRLHYPTGMVVYATMVYLLQSYAYFVLFDLVLHVERNLQHVSMYL